MYTNTKPYRLQNIKIQLQLKHLKHYSYGMVMVYTHKTKVWNCIGVNVLYSTYKLILKKVGNWVPLLSTDELVSVMDVLNLNSILKTILNG